MPEEQEEEVAGKIGPLDNQGLSVIIRNLRKAMNVRQQQLADQAKVTSRTMVKIENGKEAVRPYHLAAVCKALGFELLQETYYTLIPIKKESS